MKFLLLILFFIFISCSIYDSEDCHTNIVLRNNIDQTIYFSRNLTKKEIKVSSTSSETFCKMNILDSIPPLGGFRLSVSLYDCLESLEKNDGYIVGSIFITNSRKLFSKSLPCTDFHDDNIILREYNLTLKEYRQSGYVIDYP